MYIFEISKYLNPLVCPSLYILIIFEIKLVLHFLHNLASYFLILPISFLETKTFYVSSYKGRTFRIGLQPSDHSLYSEEFRFTLEKPRGNLEETPYFIYPAVLKEKSFVTPELDVVNYTSFPLDVVVLSSDAEKNARKIYLIDRGRYGQMISLHSHRNDSCCGRKTVFSFDALNVSEPGESIKEDNTRKAIVPPRSPC